LTDVVNSADLSCAIIYVPVPTVCTFEARFPLRGLRQMKNWRVSFVFYFSRLKIKVLHFTSLIVVPLFIRLFAERSKGRRRLRSLLGEIKKRRW
jgi:hypothetical protein